MIMLQKYKTVRFIFLSFIVIFMLPGCFSILKAPSITFTQSQTIAERQMIGEDKELEKDGWLISSIRASASGTEDWKKDSAIDSDELTEDKEYVTNLKILAYTASEIKKLKMQGVVGETLDGLIGFNPLYKPKPSKNPKTDSSETENKERTQQIVSLVNNCRTQLMNSRETYFKKRPDVNDKKIAEYQRKLRQDYHEQTEYGEFYEIKKGKWAIKE